MSADFRLHAASADAAQKDSRRAEVGAPSLKAADIGKHVRATCLLRKNDPATQALAVSPDLPKKSTARRQSSVAAAEEELSEP